MITLDQQGTQTNIQLHQFISFFGASHMLVGDHCKFHPPNFEKFKNSWGDFSISNPCGGSNSAGSYPYPAGLS